MDLPEPDSSPAPANPTGGKPGPTQVATSSSATAQTPRFAWRRPVLLILVCGAVVHLAPRLGPEPGLVQVALFVIAVAYIVALVWTVWRVFGLVDRRLVGSTAFRLAAVAVGGAFLLVSAAVFGKGKGHFGVGPSGLSWNWAVEAALVGATPIFWALINLVTEGFTALTRGLLHLRTRVAAVALASAAFAAVLALVVHGGVRLDGVGLPAWTMAALAGLATLLLAAAPVIAFAGRVARGVSEPVQRSAAALARVGRGDLDVRLEVQGRDELAQMAAAFNEMVVGLREKVFLETAFGRYASPAVLAALRDAGGLTLAAERREATVLFADIRGFTSWSESVAPEEVMRALNAYFERVVQVVEAHGGYVNKFIGDAIMVIFNAPHAQQDHAALGLGCARAMQAAIRELNHARAFGEKQLQVGVGVNTGPLVAGTLGAEKRAEYTVIGDTVNVASRLCSNAGPGEILVGARTAQVSAMPGLEPIAPLKVKGKSEPLEVFRVPAAA